MYTTAITAANGNIELAQKGIVYIDEIDKIAELEKTEVLQGMYLAKVYRKVY